MTTKAQGITLPVYPYLSLTSAYIAVTTTEADFTVNSAYKYGPAVIQPYNLAPILAEAPVDFTLKAQNASGSFAASGGDINLNPGVGTLGQPSGNLIVADTSGNGGAYNTAHVVFGANLHLWLDSSNKLRYKSGVPSTATDGNIVNLELSGSKTYDPANIVAGSSLTTTVTVAGAALGDFVLISFTLDLAELIVTAYVSAANTVTVKFYNNTVADINLGSGTLAARVIKA